ncbi:MAG: hypothetical protein AAGE84_28850 [Cyanobacteria bacterium P01_G01_bin.39]
MMNNWKIVNYIDPVLENRKSWVYYKNFEFQNIHFSRCIANSNQDHMATDDHEYYYYGVTKSFNKRNIPDDIKNLLVRGWNNYFSVR